MYMVGGGSDRVHRGSKPYPGATRYMAPPRPPINWRRVLGNACIAVVYLMAIIPGMWMLVACLG